MRKVLIGSSAGAKLFDDFPRQPKDEDWAVDGKDAKSRVKGIEYLYNPVLIDWLSGRKINRDELYTLKMSHIFWKLENGSFEKHLYDIIWMGEKGCKLIHPLFNQLYKFWNDVHGKNKRSDLTLSSDDFFDNALENGHLHDYWHTILNPNPTYLKVLKNGAEVEVCEQKFNSLSFEDKVALVKEEVMLMSWERKFHKDFRISYGRMLRKFVREHAPIWEAIWILQNWKSVCAPDFDYFTLLNTKTNKNGTDN